MSFRNWTGKKRAFILYLFLAACGFMVKAQEPEQREQLRLQIWSDLDPYPGRFEDDGSERKPEKPREEPKDELHRVFGYAIDNARKIAPYLMGGMLDGFSFEYTPYDKTRKVQEFWEFSEIRPFNSAVNKLEYRKPIVKENMLLCWVYCDRTPEQILGYESWCSIVHPKIKGTGRGKVSDGFDGIKEACSNAAKNAVREYWRSLVKNKPKEISGSMLLIRTPRIYIRDGQYVVDLDFFLQTDKIVSYSCY